MPKTPINYSNACIYKVVCNDINIPECYVGSTSNFSQRKRQHKFSCNNEKDKHYNLNVYQFIRDHGGWDNWSMVEIEKYECKDGRELETRERYYIEHLKAELNKYIPTRTIVEWREDNKDKLNEYKKQYSLDNKDKIKENKRTYYFDNKEKVKQYLLDNKDKIKQNKKQYGIDNANRLKQKHNCVCGGKYTTQSKSTHEKTKKHQAYVATLENN